MTASAPPCAASPRRGNARGRYLYLWMTTKAQMHAALPVALRTSARQTSLPLRERTFSSGARPHRALRIPAACAFGASLLALLPTLGASRRPGPRPRGTCVLCTAHASPLPVPRCCCCLHTNLLPSSYIAAAAAPGGGKVPLWQYSGRVHQTIILNLTRRYAAKTPRTRAIKASPAPRPSPRNHFRHLCR